MQDSAKHPVVPVCLETGQYHASLFEPENFLGEARRQKNIPEGHVPPICILDPDGDIVNNMIATSWSFLGVLSFEGVKRQCTIKFKCYG